jgi:hypothetical protein
MEIRSVSHYILLLSILMPFVSQMAHSAAGGVGFGAGECFSKKKCTWEDQ